MPRIDENFLDCVFYIYPSQQDAIHGEKIGGCGFFVSIKSKDIPSLTHLYAVTNAHVIRQSNTIVLRVNLKDEAKGFETIQTENRKWIYHPDGDDVAVYHLIGSITNDFKIFSIGISVFASDTIVETLKLGPGDEVFMIGRFVNHEGKQRNLPTVRFGNIAMMPIEPVIMPKTGIRQESFIVEVRSLPGYSGSPVFWYIPDFSRRPGSSRLEARPYRGLLGIDAGHFESKILITDSKGEAHPDKWQASLNSGMAIIVPAWKILELLNSEDVEAGMDNWEKETIKVAHQINSEYEEILKQLDSQDIPEEHREENQRRMAQIGVSLRRWLGEKGEVRDDDAGDRANG